MAPFNPDPSLVVTSGAGPAHQIPISFRGVVLGRDVRFGPPFSTDEFVSRSHVWVRRRGDGVEVTDLGSANGTYVNGTRVRAPTLMQHSDVLRIGQIHLKLAAPGEPDRPVARTRELLHAADRASSSRARTRSAAAGPTCPGTTWWPGLTRLPSPR